MNIHFGENIKEMRLKGNITQKELALFLGVSFQTISKWECGNTYPDITLLPEIADFFNVTVDELLGVSNKENEQKINDYIALFDNTYYTDTDSLMKTFENAVVEFPNDFRILVRYMELITEIRDHPFIKDPDKGVDDEVNNSGNPYKAGLMKNPEYEVISQKMLSIYNYIQNKCTNDDIRIHSKQLMIKHLMIRYICVKNRACKRKS